MNFNFLKDEWWPVFIPLTEGDCKNYKHFYSADIDEDIVKEYVSLFTKFKEAYENLYDKILKME